VSDTDKVPDDGATNQTSRLMGASALKTHATLVVGLALCTTAFLFELGRAERGNELSWAYVFEWPLLAIFAIYMWWKILHPGFTIRRPQAKPVVAPQFEGMLQAWQSEVAKLDARRRSEEAENARHDSETVTHDE
jgi:hypothetical protein